MLQSYYDVLAREGLDARQDSFFYRMLLMMALDARPDW